MSKGFLCIPRSLEYDSKWIHYSLKYRALYIFILSNCVFKEYEYNLAGLKIPLKPGQMMTSIRDLTNNFNKTVTHADDKFTKSSTHRALGVFMRDQKAGHQAVQHAGHIETLITIIDPIVYEIFFHQVGTHSGTGNGTTVGQVRDSIKRTTKTKTNNDIYNKDEYQDVRPLASAIADSPFAHASVFSSAANASSGEPDFYAFAHDYVFPTGDRIKEKTLLRWFRVYGPEEVYEAIQYYEKMKDIKFIPKPEAYLETTLKFRHWETAKLRENAKEREKKHEKEKKQRYS